MHIPIGDDAGTEGDPKFVTALSRGLAVLRAFRRDEGSLTNQTLAARTALPKATITRLTYTLCKLGYLSQAGDGSYRLGPGVLTLGYGALAGTQLRKRAEAELAELCEGENPNVAAALGERYADWAVYLLTHTKKDSVAMAFHLGARVPLFQSAIGRALLLTMTDSEQDALLEQTIARVAPEARPILVGGLSKAREDHATYGFCTSFGEWRAEINGIAAPVVPRNGDRRFAINVGGFSFLNPADYLIENHGERLLRAARNLELAPESAA